MELLTSAGSIGRYFESDHGLGVTLDFVEQGGHLSYTPAISFRLLGIIGEVVRSAGVQALTLAFC